MIKTVSDDNKEKGDLLEKIASDFLRTQGFTVENQVSKIGAEFDLICVHTTTSKKIYVECKNRKEGIDGPLIRQLIGDLTVHKDCQEVWLITTSDLTKGAKGIVDELPSDIKVKLPIYTPEKLEGALVKSNIIKSSLLSTQKVIDFVGAENLVGNCDLVVTGKGYYYSNEILYSGEVAGYIFVYANTLEVVKDVKLLNFFNDSDQFDKNNCLAVEKYNIEALPREEIKCPTTFALCDDYLTSVNDIGMKIAHPHKDVLVVEDIFIYQMLERIDSDKRDKFDSKILGDGGLENNKIVLFGEDLSGKTALSQKLQIDLNKQGKVPIYLNASDIKKSDFNSFKNILKKEFKRQYGQDKNHISCFDLILGENLNQVPIIIDDFESFAIQLSKSKIEFFQMLTEKFEKVIIFCNQSHELEAMTSSESGFLQFNFLPLRIKPFGYYLLDKLIKKWLIAGNGELLTDEEMDHKIHEMSLSVRIAVGTNFVPMYPLYLLTILQLSETTFKSKIQGNSYAELYGSLVNQSLGSVGVKPVDLDFYHAYLSYVAFNFFKENKRIVEKDVINRIHDSFCLEMDVKKDFVKILEVLCNAKVITQNDECYKFSHNYSHYYFTSRYLSENSDDLDVKNELDKIFMYLHKIEYANILLFLVHHSKDRDLISRIVNESQRLFSDYTPNTLKLEELKSVSGFLESELRLELKEQKTSEYREEKLKKEDDRKDSVQKQDDGIDDQKERSELDLFATLNLALKLIEIQGQLTQSYYGSLKAVQKIEVMFEVYSLGFRSLSALLNDYPVFIETLKSIIEEGLKKKGLYSDEERIKISKKIISNFTERLVMFFVRRVSDSLSSKELMITLDKLVETKNTPAIILVNLAAKLNFPDRLDTDYIVALDRSFEGNYLAKKILRFILIEHLYKFNVDYKTKQSLCNKLDIDYSPKKTQLGIGHKQ